MKRRNFLVGVGGATIGGSALIGSGAFSRVESDRAVNIEVAPDPDAYLGMNPLEGDEYPNGDNYAHLDEKGHIFIDIGENPNYGLGVNSNSKTWFDFMLELCNQGKDDVYVSLDDEKAEIRENAKIFFYSHDGDGNKLGEIELGTDEELHFTVGDCVYVGIRTETHSVNATDEGPLLSGKVTVQADVESGGA